MNVYIILSSFDFYIYNYFSYLKLKSFFTKEIVFEHLNEAFIYVSVCMIRFMLSNFSKGDVKMGVGFLLSLNCDTGIALFKFINII